jgi:hypothetical protein
VRACVRAERHWLMTDKQSSKRVLIERRRCCAW